MLEGFEHVVFKSRLTQYCDEEFQVEFLLREETLDVGGKAHVRIKLAGCNDDLDLTRRQLFAFKDRV